MDQPELGKLIDKPVGRDAVHAPVFPAVCNGSLNPGDKLRIIRGKRVGDNYAVGWLPPTNKEYDAVVDPFLTDAIPPGASFYAVLRPGSVTGLRHVYTHPALGPGPVPTRFAPEQAQAAREEIARGEYEVLK